MSRRFAIGLIILFVGLTIIYFRHAIFAPIDTWMIRYQGSDLYIYGLGAYERLGMLKDGFLPLGDYWIPRGGGYSATLQELLLTPAHLLLLGTYAITNSFTIALKILYPLFYLTTLFTAYWYGTTILKGITSSSNVKFGAIILAVTYAFSMFGVNTLEQLVFISTPPLLLLTLIFLEKTIKESRPLHIILTAVFLLLVYITQLYPAYFLTLFIGFRLLFAWKRKALQSATKGGLVFLLIAAPIFIPQILNIPSQEVKDVLATQTAALALLPGLFFYKGDPMAFLSEASTAYLGLATLALALIPTILHYKLEWRRTYIFYLLVALASIIFALGQYSPINFALLVQKYLPLSFFLRAPGRAMVIGYLALSVCAALGFTILIDYIKPKYRTLTTLAIVLIIFTDLTIGYEPPSMSPPLPQNEAYEFLREQPGDFRTVEMPSIYPQMAMSNIHTNHDILSTYSWAFGYFDPLQAFANQYNNYLDLTATEQETAFYGIKYILVNTDPNYYSRLASAITYYNSPKLEQVVPVADYLDTSKDYRLVYDKGGYAVYENLLYQGTVFPSISYNWTDSNTLEIEAYDEEPQTIFISQSYTEGWIAKVNGVQTPIHEVNFIQSIEVPAGDNHIVIHYERYESSLLNFLAFHLTALLIILLLLYPKWKRYTLPILLTYGVGLIIFSLTVYPYSTPLYHSALTYLGIALTIGALIYILLRRRLKWT